MHRPNIILILVDDLGYGDLGIYGNPHVKTPHLDRLAGEGVRLDQYYSSSPLCAPARTGLLTGRYNHRTGAISVESNRGLDRIALRERTLAEYLQRAGYATGMVGKWHNGLHDMRYHPNARGFDEFCGFLNGGMPYWDWTLERNGAPFSSDGTYLTDLFSAEAIGFVERHQRDPFFLYLAYNAPHSPLEAPAEEVQPYLEHYPPGVATLYGMVSRLDRGVGRLLDSLDSLGLSDDTLVLFTSDNGPWLGPDILAGERVEMARYNGPFRGMKQDVLEGGIRVPAFLRWPAGLPAGRVEQQMLHACDWLPTLLAACGIESENPLALDGVDALAKLRGAEQALPAQRFWQYNRYDPVPHCNAAMRDGPWKLYWPRVAAAMQKLEADNEAYRANFAAAHRLMSVANPPVERAVAASASPELYRLDRDPSERENLAAAEPERLERMCRALDDWFAEVERERRQIAHTLVD